MKYPIFRNPQEYLAFRKGNFFAAPFRKWSEFRSLDRCLKGLGDIKTVCDCPCGPGRLFEYWKKQDLDTIGVDLSDEMVEAAGQKIAELKIPGRAVKADAFHLEENLPQKPDLIASIRFFYYFDRSKRIELLKSLAAASDKYILVQYKTASTIKGRITFPESKNKPYPKKYCSYTSMTEEIAEAGLLCLRVVFKGDSSDRVFVLAQKFNANSAPVDKVKIYRPRLLANSLLAAAAVMLFVGASTFYRGILWDTQERQIEQIAKQFQDGNDHFYVTNYPCLEDLRTNSRLSKLWNFEDAENLAAIDKIQAEDSFFLVKEKDLDKIDHIKFWNCLTTFKKITVQSENYVLFTTEQDVPIPNQTGSLLHAFYDLLG